MPIGYPTDGSNTTHVTHYFTLIDSTLRSRILYMLLTMLLTTGRTLNFDLTMGRHVDYDQCLITRVIMVWDV
jgi:hypothetical protein